MSHLTRYDLTFVGIRLLTLYLILQIIAGIPSNTTLLIMSISILFGQTGGNQAYPFIYKLMVLGLPMLTLLAPILLWIFTDKIAKCMSASSQALDNAAIGNINLQDFQTSLFVVAGVFLFVLMFPQFIFQLSGLMYGYIHKQQLLEWLGPQELKLFANGLALILSLVLMFKAKCLAGLLRR